MWSDEPLPENVRKSKIGCHQYMGTMHRLIVVILGGVIMSKRSERKRSERPLNEAILN